MKPFSHEFVQPTNSDLAEFKSYVGWSTNELAKLIDIKPKNFREYLTDMAYIRGKKIKYAPWRLLLESFGLVQPDTLSPKTPKLRAEIFNNGNDWQQPTSKEIRLLFKRSEMSFNKMIELLGLNDAVNNHIKESKQNQVITVAKDSWIQFLKKIHLESFDDFIKLPSLPANTLYTLENDYHAPRPHILRKFVTWTGYTSDELARLVNMKESEFGFYCSNKSFRGGDDTAFDGLFSRDNWRPPYSRELRSIIITSKCDQAWAANKLGIGFNFLKRCMTSSNSSLVHVDKDRWLSFLDELGHFSVEEFNKLALKQSANKPIPYSTWRILLHIFGIVKPVIRERKQASFK